MDTVSWLTIAIVGFPLVAVLITGLFGARVLRGASHLPVVLAIAASFIASVGLFQQLRLERATSVDGGRWGYAHVVTLWSWVGVENAGGDPGLRVDVTLRADPLTSMMQMMVSGISLFVAVFAAGYMKGDRGYWRFFTYIALFVFSMLMLVSVSSFLLLFVFWEAVGVCSYLLIGFWYQRPSAAAAGMKAFLVNRVGDFGFTLAIFLIWLHYGTLDFHDVALEQTAAGAVAVTDPVQVAQLAADAADGSNRVEIVDGVLGRRRIASGTWVGGTAGLAICLLLMWGACGKSAQFPLHVWLPDAMEGPTPVSALIHAATMVTAGVYLIVRCSPLFVATPTAQLIVAVVGGFTALLAALIALTQYDLKRVLAYSTVSQLGYMFLGVGAASLAGITAGMFHLLTHAFFKALLFLGAGSVMHAMGNVIDMRKFGGLRRLMPYTHATFLIGALALAGIFPLSGFWSKDAIMGAVHDRIHHLEHAAAGEAHGDDAPAAGEDAGEAALHLWHAKVYRLLYYAGMITVWLTAFYTFRAVFMTFYGKERVPEEAGHHAHESPPSMVVPLVVLATGAAVVGLLLDRSMVDGTHPFAQWIAGTPSLSLPALAESSQPGQFHMAIASVSTLIALIGIGLAAHLYLGPRDEVRWLKSFLDLEWFARLSSIDWLLRFRTQGAWGAVERAARRAGLGWFLDGLWMVLFVVLLVLATPLLVLRWLSPYRLSYHKFYFDEVYTWLIVRPMSLLAAFSAWFDRTVIDALVDWVGWVPRAIGNMWRGVQSGLISFYALAMVMAVVVFVWVRVCLM